MRNFIFSNAGSPITNMLGLEGPLRVYEILDLRPQYFGTAPLHPDRNLCGNRSGDGREVGVAMGDSRLGAWQEPAVCPRDEFRRRMVDVGGGPLVGDVDADVAEQRDGEMGPSRVAR